MLRHNWVHKLLEEAAYVDGLTLVIQSYYQYSNGIIIVGTVIALIIYGTAINRQTYAFLKIYSFEIEYSY